MKVRFARVAAVVAALFVVAPLAQAAAVPVKVDLTALRAIQTYALDVKAQDQVYLVVNGIAPGKDVRARIPKDGTLAAAPKAQPISEANELWAGELDNGQFALLTVVLFHGPEGDAKGDAGATKNFLDALEVAGKSSGNRAKPTLTAADAKALAADTLKAQRGVVEKVKDTLSRDKKTDHFGGLFNVLVWNDGGKIVKRLDPVGLTFGEHYGDDEKIYTKLKFTRNNVLVKDESGSFFPQQFTPVSEDKTTVRVKMLETDFAMNAKGKKQRNATDYLADLQVTAGGKPLEWTLGGENPSDKGPLHPYWDFAE